MFTKWDQIEDWIKDCGFKHWIFYVNNPDKRADGDRSNDKILDSKFFAGDIDEKLEMTKKLLERYGNRCYGLAFQSETSTTGGCWCEVRLDQAAQAAQMFQQPVQGTNFTQPDETAIAAKIRKEIMTEIKEQKLEEDRKALDAEKREFMRDKNSAIGIMVGYLKPLLDSKISGLVLPKVAGVDATSDVRAARIVPSDAQEQGDVQEENPLSDAEADKAFALVCRLKKAEPRYLELLEEVVKLAESQDSKYVMAKSVLLPN